jgi:hypothetical protein
LKFLSQRSIWGSPSPIEPAEGFVNFGDDPLFERGVPGAALSFIAAFEQYTAAGNIASITLK